MLEYIKVFGGYIFLMFIWPTVVFWDYLKTKTKRFHFGFCATVQIINVNTIILMLGFFHILNERVTLWIFYGIFFGAILRIGKAQNIDFLLSGDKQIRKQIWQNLRTKILKKISALIEEIRPRIWEYILLMSVIAFGMIYFSYDEFQMCSYGHYDIFTHHRWINEMIEGHIFPDGVYPVAMHCFIYCLYALFGIRVYSIMLFLQCIHIAVFLLTAYSLFREIFYWRYSPIFVIGLYLTLDFIFEYSMSRLQCTLPMEFGLHTEFLCALYLIKYLKSERQIVFKGKKLVYCWDENLLLFMMSLAASVAIHYYTTMMAFFICASFAVFRIKKVVKRKHLIPLLVSVLCGFVIAVTPMIGAVVSGIPLEGSIYWGINSINKNNDNNTESISSNSEKRNPLQPTSEDLEVVEKLPHIVRPIVKYIIKLEYFIKAIYKYGYQGMYWEKRGRRIFEMSLVVVVLCLVSRKQNNETIRKISGEYTPMILASALSMLIFAAYDASGLSFPVLIPDHRICTTGHMLVLAVMMMPADFIFSIASIFIKIGILRMVSIVSAVGIYAFTNMFGIYHGFLYYRLMRYNPSVLVTNSIIEELPQNSYTIVSPTEEEPQVSLYGKHEEISCFIVNCDKVYYSIPTEYVFIYVEKRPLVYFQYYYFDGPSWLGNSGNSNIEATEISKEAAEKKLTKELTTENNGRTIIESKAYEWCQHFSELNPLVMNVYYEDENFVCYYFKQDIEAPYNLGL